MKECHTLNIYLSKWLICLIKSIMLIESIIKRVTINSKSNLRIPTNRLIMAPTIVHSILFLPRKILKLKCRLDKSSTYIISTKMPKICLSKQQKERSTLADLSFL